MRKTIRLTAAEYDALAIPSLSLSQSIRKHLLEADEGRNTLHSESDLIIETSISIDRIGMDKAAVLMAANGIGDFNGLLRAVAASLTAGKRADTRAEARVDTEAKLRLSRFADLATPEDVDRMFEAWDAAVRKKPSGGKERPITDFLTLSSDESQGSSLEGHLKGQSDPTGGHSNVS
jgi:hypothetical protein